MAKQGQITALVGPSGSGKSTVSHLAARFWDADEGQVLLGGVDVTTVEPETLFQNYAIVFQDVTLFDNSIMENIRLGKAGATDEEVMAAAKAPGVRNLFLDCQMAITAISGRMVVLSLAVNGNVFPLLAQF